MSTSTTDVPGHLQRSREAVDSVLAEWGERARQDIGGCVGDAIAYALAGPGKRFRPALVMAVYRELGGRGPIAELAAAVEVVHTYSLVHDDLPCMDDDDLRRGRPTTHVAFDVPTATRAGFRMVPMAARVLAAGSRRLGLGEATLSAIGVTLFDAAGARGMVGGQVLDLEAEGRSLTLQELERIHRMKTGALISASAIIGALAAGAPDPVRQAMGLYGMEVGMAFQIADDVLDATGTSAELGKTAGKDARQGKATFVSLLGIDGARSESARHVQLAVDRLGAVGIDSPLLNDLAEYIITRRR